MRTRHQANDQPETTPPASKIKAYYRLTKPGIIYANVLTGAAGYVSATHWHIHFGTIVFTLFGMSGVIACACVLNNIMDRRIDAVMERTKRRALVSGQISPIMAAIYGLILGLAGFSLLVFGVNRIVVGIGLVGFIDYVLVYGWSKRHTKASTLVGSISGATPILAGFVAGSDRISTEAILLFLAMVFWQMPHFYAIATFRLDDYQSADLPVLPVKQGAETTKNHIMTYMVGYTLVLASLSAFGYMDRWFLVVLGLICIYWLIIAVKGFWAENNVAWARQTFFTSLLVLLSFCLMLFIDPLIK